MKQMDLSRVFTMVAGLALLAACSDEPDRSALTSDSSLTRDLDLATQTSYPGLDSLSAIEQGLTDDEVAAGTAAGTAVPRAGSSPATATRRTTSSAPRRSTSTSTRRTSSTSSGSVSAGSSSGSRTTSEPATREVTVKNTKRDAAIGAAAGAVLGAATSRDKVKGAVIGAAAGGILGGIIGNNVDVQKKRVPVDTTP